MKTINLDALRIDLEWLKDRAFPIARPCSPEERLREDKHRAERQREWRHRSAALKGDEETLNRYYSTCHAALEDERQRLQNADGRLTSIMGLSSVAGTLVFGTMLTNLPQTYGLLSWFGRFMLFYLTIQVASALLAGVRGLDRKSNPPKETCDLLPAPNEAPAHHLRRQILDSLTMIAQHQDLTSAKLSQVRTANTAVKNFICGLLLLALIASAHQYAAPPASDPLLKRLKNDHALRELIRSTVGPTAAPIQCTTPIIDQSGATAPSK